MSLDRGKEALKESLNQRLIVEVNVIELDFFRDFERVICDVLSVAVYFPNKPENEEEKQRRIMEAK